MNTTLKIHKLERELESQEHYIKYLYCQIEGQEAEIEELRRNNEQLRLKLKNALSSISLKEEALQTLEQQLIDFEEKNIQLKNRIQTLVTKFHNMAQVNLDPINTIINHNLPNIADRVQHIRQYTEGDIILNRDNLNRQYEGINHHLDLIRQAVTPYLNTVQLINNIRAERNQYRNLLQDENGRVNQLRNELNNARAQVLRVDQMMTDALNDERNARREHWELAQNRLAEINNIQRERMSIEGMHTECLYAIIMIQKDGVKKVMHAYDRHKIGSSTLKMKE